MMCSYYAVCRKDKLFLKNNRGVIGDDIFNLFFSSISFTLLDSIIDHILKNHNVSHKTLLKRVGKIDLFLIKALFFTLVATSVVEAVFDVENEKCSDLFFKLNRVDGSLLMTELMIILF